jgi:2-haloacid dehalogenase
MQQLQLTNIKACVFDAYGTLFDVHSAVGTYRARVGNQADQVSAVWRTKQLEYTWLRSLMGKHVDFWRVTQDALDYAFATFGLTDQELSRALMQAYLQLDCYPEVPDVLSQLKQRGMRTAILSNGSPTMLDAAVRHAGLQDTLDAVLSIEAVGIFKPSPRVYQLVVDELGVPAQQICFQSSNAWDVAGANSFGLRVVWVNRFGQQAERLGTSYDAELQSLAGLPALVSR